MKRLKIQLLFKILTIVLCLTSVYITFNYCNNFKFNNELINKGIITKIDHKNKYSIISIKSNTNAIAYIYDKTNLGVGDIIVFNYQYKDIQENTIPNIFDYKNYLKSINVKNVIVIDKYKIIGYNKYYKFKNKLYKLSINKKSKNYIFTFLFSDKSYMDIDVKNSYIDNGISHLFCVSGFHVLFLLSVLRNFLSKIFKNQNVVLIFLIVFSYAYLLNTSSTISLLRAFLMYYLLYFKKRFNLSLSTLHIFIITLDICLIFKPYSIYSSSFWYTFILSFFLIKYSSKVDKINYFKNLLFVTLYAFLVSVPLTLYFNYKISIMSVIYSSFFSILVCYIFYPLSFLALCFNRADNILYFFSYRFEKINLYLSNIKSFNLIFPKFNCCILLILYIFLYLYVNNYKIKYLIVYLLSLLMIYFSVYFNSSFYIYYIDVGQGDANLLINKYHKNVTLIDTGGLKNNIYLNHNLRVFFHSLGIRKINNLIITHGDFDHMGEAINIVNNFKVEKVIFNCGEYNDLEQELIKVLEKKNIKYYSCIKELNIDNNKLYFLQTKEYGNENDNSNVIYTEINGYKFMFMGDASITTEKEILSKYNLSNVDVLKVGHHGSKTSSGKEFINEINPNYSIISVGKNNRYGHPNKDVLENLKNSKIYRTDIDGSIMFKIKNNKLKIGTCLP